ncbi:MAG: hypothetical protein KF819_04765 [Labilithrix sp.]|nr:hypothetical protein [Labilithrix sp.]
MDAEVGMNLSHSAVSSALVVLGVVGCSTSSADDGGDGSSADAGAAATTIATSGYAQECTTDRDCVAVVAGDVCNFCNACKTNAAIAAREAPRFRADVDAKTKLCDPNAPPVSCTEECPQRRAICEGAKCVHDDCKGGCAPRDAGSD